VSRVRRVKPSTVAGRKRQAELGQIISSPRTSKEDHAAALEELNLLAPVIGSSPDGSLSENEDTFPNSANPNPVRTGPQDLGTLLSSVSQTVCNKPRSIGDLDRRRYNLLPLLNRGERTPEVLAYARDAARVGPQFWWGKNFDEVSPAEQDAAAERVLQAYIAMKPSH
jgi:hypothetical protein